MIYSVRAFKDVSWLAERLDNEDARQAGIYIKKEELEYYKASPWIEAFALIKGTGIESRLLGFASVNLSERIYGRGIFSEFYLPPEGRRSRLTGYRFYRDILDMAFAGCHRIVAYTKTDNFLIQEILKRLGWKMECAVKRFDRTGATYMQFSIGGQGVIHG